MYQWLIYLLYDANGFPDYVGSTNNLKRRLKEHKKVIGFRPRYTILECGTDPNLRYHAEERWMNHYRSSGAKLRNIQEIKGGILWTHASTREKISRVHKGRKASAETRARMSAATKGVAKNWTDDGRAKSEKTRFKKGQSTWLTKTEAQKADHRERSRRNWDGVSKDTRSAMSTARNLTAWSSRSKEERSAVANKIVATRRRNHTPEELSRIHSETQNKIIERHPELRERFSKRVKGWWAALTPEAKSEYVARRAIAIKKAKDEKRARERAAIPQLSLL